MQCYSWPCYSGSWPEGYDRDLSVVREDHMARAFSMATATVALAAFASTAFAATTCDVPSMQAAAPKETTVVAASMIQDPVPHCKVEGYTITNNPGPNKVAFGVQLPEKSQWNHRFYF